MASVLNMVGGGGGNQGTLDSIGYSGNTSVLENDGKSWEVALLTSGTLSVYKQVAVDIFLCGGGGGGGRGLYAGGLGGGGGYTKNLFNIILGVGTYTVDIGSGGAGGTSDAGDGARGGTTSITGVTGASADGGYGGGAGASGAGGNGGSGGGGGTSSNKGAGGSDGDGGVGGSLGQELSTRAYLEPTNTLYAGGGGGGTRSTTGAAGGAGGGAKGGALSNGGSSAAINTGGGGGGGGGRDAGSYMIGGNGGSGIIRIRSHNHVQPEYPIYEGDYEITPSTLPQTMETDNHIMTDDVIINAIPSNYGQITWDGIALTVS